MELTIKVPGKADKTIAVSDKLLAQEFNEPLIHQVVTAYLSAARAGTSSQKTRAEVRGGGKKPWKQKGTGRARAGTIRSPIWRGGGKTFAAKMQDYSQKVNKKMYRAAIRSILSELARQGNLIIVDTFSVATPKTKEFIVQLKAFDAKSALIITNEVDENLYLAARNLHTVEIRDVEGIDPVCLVKFEKVIMTTAALKQLEEKLG